MKCLWKLFEDLVQEVRRLSNSTFMNNSLFFGTNVSTTCHTQHLPLTDELLQKQYVLNRSYGILNISRTFELIFVALTCLGVLSLPSVYLSDSSGSSTVCVISTAAIPYKFCGQTKRWFILSTSYDIYAFLAVNEIPLLMARNLQLFTKPRKVIYGFNLWLCQSNFLNS